MIKTITLKYDEKDFKKLEKRKSIKSLNWEDFVFWAIINATYDKEEAGV